MFLINTIVLPKRKQKTILNLALFEQSKTVIELRVGALPYVGKYPFLRRSLTHNDPGFFPLQSTTNWSTMSTFISKIYIQIANSYAFSEITL